MQMRSCLPLSLRDTRIFQSLFRNADCFKQNLCKINNKKTLPVHKCLLNYVSFCFTFPLVQHSHLPLEPCWCVFPSTCTDFQSRTHRSWARKTLTRNPNRDWSLCKSPICSRGVSLAGRLGLSASAMLEQKAVTGLCYSYFDASIYLF